MNYQQKILNAIGAETLTPEEAHIIIDMQSCKIEAKKVIEYIKILRRAEQFRKKREEEGTK
jgi:hypothetical protein